MKPQFIRDNLTKFDVVLTELKNADYRTIADDVLKEFYGKSDEEFEKREKDFELIGNYFIEYGYAESGPSDSAFFLLRKNTKTQGIDSWQEVLNAYEVENKQKEILEEKSKIDFELSQLKLNDFKEAKNRARLSLLLSIIAIVISILTLLSKILNWW